eukprot:TRINITY_DN93428_c0_g1_i1.p1 TRINITY_DN93428_c0_g1~~TRINITY_DN93428_c0_g1_i1.p1  ORF type:complete len:423 (+),score=45.15 TRINITY_DN93428_c0_g1_i1:28-1269(+)
MDESAHLQYGAVPHYGNAPSAPNPPPYNPNWRPTGLAGTLHSTTQSVSSTFRGFNSAAVDLCNPAWSKVRGVNLLENVAVAYLWAISALHVDDQQQRILIYVIGAIWVASKFLTVAGLLSGAGSAYDATILAATRSSSEVLDFVGNVRWWANLSLLIGSCGLIFSSYFVTRSTGQLSTGIQVALGSAVFVCFAKFLDHSAAESLYLAITGHRPLGIKSKAAELIGKTTLPALIAGAVWVFVLYTNNVQKQDTSVQNGHYFQAIAAAALVLYGTASSALKWSMESTDNVCSAIIETAPKPPRIEELTRFPVGCWTGRVDLLHALLYTVVVGFGAAMVATPVSFQDHAEMLRPQHFFPLGIAAELAVVYIVSGIYSMNVKHAQSVVKKAFDTGSIREVSARVVPMPEVYNSARFD